MGNQAENNNNNNELKAWVVTISMGLGHQRGSYPLAHLAQDHILHVGQPEVSSESEMKLWRNLTSGYETVSRLKKIPVIGKIAFGALNRFLYIPPFYPFRDLSKPSFQVNLIRSYIKKGLGKALMERIYTKPLPMISSYPIPSIIADYYDYSRNYCIVTDAEINRAWVPADARKSKTIYLAPCSRALNRLKEYGVPDESIFLTGFPLPKSILGSEKLEILRHDVGQRLHYLDPEDRFWPLHGTNVKYFLGNENIGFKKDRVLSIVYAVGGAGALADIGIKAAKSLKNHIKKKELKLTLVAGIKKEVRDYFVEGIKELGFAPGEVPIVHSSDLYEYFDQFTALMRTTDILWTKPSELVFYAALGMPIIMAEPIGSQEGYNQKWCVEIQAGITQDDPEYANEWLLDLWKYGRLAEAGWDGFLKARKFGTFKVEEILRTGTMVREKSPLKR
ncbi:MAG: hypothetical protein JW969_11175 [Spirochaetales bacterium]|nr:hypothetical protein [Spirochaetales bacterium]